MFHVIGACKGTSLISHLKLGLHITICKGYASKRILKPSTYRLQIFLVRDQCLRSFLPHGDQTIAGLPEKHVLKPMRAILTTYMETRLQCGFSPTKCDENKDFVHIPLRIPVKHI